MEQYTIKMENFEGPLDLLCHLIEKNKMDICDIKICEITDQYLAYLNEKSYSNSTSDYVLFIYLHVTKKNNDQTICYEKSESFWQLSSLSG